MTKETNKQKDDIFNLKECISDLLERIEKLEEYIENK